MKYLLLMMTLWASAASAAETFPLTQAAWERLHVIRKDDRFYFYCFAKAGPAKDLADAIAKAHAVEGQKLALSDCTKETVLIPEHIHELGMVYCKQGKLDPRQTKIEAGLTKCLSVK